MKIATAKLVPYSSIVGRSIALLNAAGAQIGQLAVQSLSIVNVLTIALLFLIFQSCLRELPINVQSDDIHRPF